MKSVRKTLATLSMTAAALAGAALLSGWLAAAQAGGGYWTG